MWTIQVKRWAASAIVAAAICTLSLENARAQGKEAPPPSPSKAGQGAAPQPSPSPSPTPEPGMKLQPETVEAAKKAMQAWDALQAAKCADPASPTGLSAAQKAFDRENSLLSQAISEEVSKSPETWPAQDGEKEAQDAHTADMNDPHASTDRQLASYNRWRTAFKRRDQVRKKVRADISGELKRRGYVFRAAACPDHTVPVTPPSPHPMPKPRRTSGLFADILSHVVVGVGVGVGHQGRGSSTGDRNSRGRSTTPSASHDD